MHGILFCLAPAIQMIFNRVRINRLITRIIMALSNKKKKAIIHFVTFFIPSKQTRRRLRNALINVYIEKAYTLRELIFGKIKIFKRCPDCFSLPETKLPLVSIIIPAYNQYHYTKLCLWSILQNSSDIEYEVILADDNSNDETQTINERIGNLKVIKTSENLRFLKNCNNAAKHARGKYLLFLNNDTQVQSGWLKPLVDLLEKDKTIGLTGSKLIYPDGMLQEAGGIVWRDATGWNYGRNKNPDFPEYNYVKEVDYISGAAIMIAKDLWNELGGFDEFFAPAYYEDTDLAFRVRNKKNLKVVYQPLSVVVHFEGKSNGTSTSSGIKAYQAVNAKKFYERWKDVLEKDHSTKENLFLARDRSQNKKTLLFVDANILTFDKDTGSRVSFQYLQFFKRAGLNVKFLPKHTHPTGKYLEALQQEGAEVILPHDSTKYWIEWLKENGKYIDYVYLNRPKVAEWCLENLKKYTNAKIIYQGHDLHFLRELRRYETEKSAEALQSSIEHKAIETAVINSVDVTCMFSEAEIEKIKEIAPNANAHTVPLFIFDTKLKKDVVYEPSKRKDIMFIGGFRHNPNIDGIRWFVKEVFPKVKKQIPDLKFYLVGSNAPDEILELTSEDIIVTGYVTDEKLDEIYRGIKISVVPLRYGAGVKGKVIEAVYNKVPVVTTTIGAEGIDNSSGILGVYDDPEIFAKELVKLYLDDERLKEISAKSLDFIDKFYSENAVRAKFKQWLEI